MLDPQEDKSDLGENQDLEIGSDELTAVKAQLSASNSESKLLNEVNKVILSPDFNYFSELSEKDERMADKVIEKIAKLKGMDEEEVRKLLIPVNESKEIDVNAEVRKAIAKEKGEQTLQDFIKETGLDKDKDLSEEFLSNFYDYMEWKKYTVDNVKKFTKSAYRDLNEDKVKSFEKKKKNIEAQISSGWNSKQTETKKEWRTMLKSNSAKDW